MPEFFQAFFSQLQTLRHYNYDDLLHVKIIFVVFRWSICLFVSSGSPCFHKFLVNARTSSYLHCEIVHTTLFSFQF